MNNKTVTFRLFLLAAVLSILPDVDVIAFKFGIPYESQWGHRGFTHSLVFSGLVAAFCTLFRRQLRSSPVAVFIVCFISCASHALLDAMTNGGLGVALYWPFDQGRYFLPYRPIEVSPIGVKSFFTDRGIRVIYSELLWVFLPGVMLSIAIVITKVLYKKRFNKRLVSRKWMSSRLSGASKNE